MNTDSGYSILKVRLQHERHVVHARQRARDVAALLGFDNQEQVRLSTATSELARNAFRYAVGGAVEFRVTAGRPQSLLIRVTDNGPGIAKLQDILDGRYQSKTGLGIGLVGTRRLLDSFAIETSPGGTTVVAGKALPITVSVTTAEQAKAISTRLAQTDVDPFEEVERQNQDLLRTLAELREKQEQLAQVNRELEDTNRGVVALYAELEQNANDLRRVSDLKTSFLTNLSHEFRTPLNAILALCQILNDRSDGDLSSEQEKQVSYIRRSAADLSELVNDLLDMAKVEAGKVDLRPRAFTVEDLFGALRGMLRTLLTSNAVELIFAAEEDLPVLFSDEGKISQILRNLISNALKFTERGSVRVTASRSGDRIVFRVIDTGIGIAPADQERVFEEFAQVENEIQTRVRGTGLGLPLARTLSELLGGSLSLESAVGIGSTFSVILPIVLREREQPPALPVVRKPNTPLVLIVEDNLETRFIHQAALKSAPYTLHFARSVEEARGIIGSTTPDLLVLDRMLDGVDALPFIEELRTQAYRGRILVVSVHDDDREPLRAGADAFLAKPVSGDLLNETLATLLKDFRSGAVLLVDDDEINRYLLCEVLAPFGFRILEASSGREAMRRVEQEELAVIFLDVAMPGMTGLETLRELKSNSKAADVPVVIHTSKDLSSAELALVENLGALQFPKAALATSNAGAMLRAVLLEAKAL